MNHVNVLKGLHSMWKGLMVVKEMQFSAFEEQSELMLWSYTPTVTTPLPKQLGYCVKHE